MADFTGENGALTPFQAFGQANIRSSRPVVAGSRLKVCDGLRGTVSPAASRSRFAPSSA
jgi:hypothetical protein